MLQRTPSKNGGFAPCVMFLIVRNFRKALSNLLHLDVQNLFLRNYWFNLFHQDLSQTLQFCRVCFDYKTIGFHPCVEFLIVQTFQKKTINLDLLRPSSYKFSKITDLISSIETQSKTLPL